MRLNKETGLQDAETIHNLFTALICNWNNGYEKVMIDSLCQSLEQDLIQNEFLIKTLEISDFELRFCKPVCTG